LDIVNHITKIADRISIDNIKIKVKIGMEKGVGHKIGKTVA
jgi:hypothetical protein